MSLPKPSQETQPMAAGWSGLPLFFFGLVAGVVLAVAVQTYLQANPSWVPAAALGTGAIVTTKLPTDQASPAAETVAVATAQSPTATPTPAPLAKVGVLFGPSFTISSKGLAYLRKEDVITYLRTALPGFEVRDTLLGDEDAVVIGFRQTARFKLGDWEVQQLQRARLNKQKPVLIGFQNASPENMNLCDPSEKVDAICLLYDHSGLQAGWLPKQEGPKHAYNVEQLHQLRALVTPPNNL